MIKNVVVGKCRANRYKYAVRIKRTEYKKGKGYMAEVLDQEKTTQAPVPVEAAQPAPAGAQAPAAPAEPIKKKKKRKRFFSVGRIIAILIILALIAAGIYAYRLYRDQNTGNEAVMTEIVQRGSVTSKVEGSGTAAAKNSASVTVLSGGGEVLDIYVKEGDEVHKGDRLYTIESSEAQAKVDDAQRSVSNYQKELKKLYEAANDLNVRATFQGKLLEVKDLKVGDNVAKGTEIAKLVDDTKLLLSLYFSYAFENDISEGQSAMISVPVTMAQIPGTVHEIRKVERISAEGTKLFEVVFAVDNPGTLTADMVATATIEAEDGEIYPYESGKLEYFRIANLTAKVTGEVEWVHLYNYDVVEEGESVLRLSGEDNEIEIATKENQLRSAQKSLEDAQKNLDSLHAVAPIDGTVLTVGIKQGEKPATGTVAVSIADTSTMLVNCMVDEMNIGYIKQGMEVSLEVWETEMTGTVQSVSLSAKSENGVARFPMVIAVDNSDGTLLTGAYVNYTIIASQSEDCLIVPLQCVKSAETLDGESCKVLFVISENAEDASDRLPVETMDIPVGFTPVIVEIGISDNYNVEILSGVEEGTVVYSGQADSSSSMGVLF